jgi:hypothetical protein
MTCVTGILLCKINALALIIRKVNESPSILIEIVKVVGPDNIELTRVFATLCLPLRLSKW